MRNLLWMVMALSLTAAPAAAGTSADPEITDACGAQHPLVEESDICAGWFETVWSDGASDQREVTGVRATLAIAADVSAQPRHVTYLMAWEIGPCAMEWLTRFEADRAARAGILRTRCAGSETQTRALAPDAVTFDEHTVSVVLTRNGALDHVAEHVFAGQRISAPVAKTWFSANTSVGVQQTVEADWTAPGNTFVLGDDGS